MTTDRLRRFNADAACEKCGHDDIDDGSMTESWPTHRRRVIIRKRRHLHGPYDGTAETCWTAGCMACGWRLCSVEWATTYEIVRIHIKVAHVLPVEVDQ